MSTSRRIPVIVLGIGNIGRAFLTQLTRARSTLSTRYGVDLVPVILADVGGAIINPAGLSDSVLEAAVSAQINWQSLAGQPNAQPDLTGLDLIRYAAEHGIEHAVVVDVTASEGMTPALLQALQQGYGVVLANKRPLAGPWANAQTFFHHTRVRFEATVGAGLPVNTTLRYLVDTGDVVHRIQGALSGTLGYLCSSLEDGEIFSSIVNTARAKGYTEPDPREDLSGIDVARKALIMARLAGWELDMDALRVDPLYPDAMRDLSVDEFMAQLPQLDSDFAAYMGATSGVPRYMAEIDANGGTVSLKMVSQQLAAQLRGTVNQVTFWTKRYTDLPLSLLGPGAGMEVTAAAVLQDCLSLAQTTN
ncbi:MAG: homoserine dehydrogenase [Anaerolineae bacterium]|nr:homoserine dehydrogenase [Anaerolineae bacterium]